MAAFPQIGDTVLLAPSTDVLDDIALTERQLVRHDVFDGLDRMGVVVRRIDGFLLRFIQRRLQNITEGGFSIALRFMYSSCRSMLLSHRIGRLFSASQSDQRRILASLAWVRASCFVKPALM